ncbi:alpha/beta hydrolase [Phytohabitans sp. ZYX-F-186]|uniref:Alpha/beta hydrolase n=1 Tax=Phytohabitans maris TaxID=3071409 RepID=A0ABU0ZD17_9ACTN|nr:alpha/beta hydrolase [Phytohabitans sp. ZYX-F-186]MDQ7904947.1 alpha/beta hydrolase [Phytohabitans sp. ZYX-F-186]
MTNPQTRTVDAPGATVTYDVYAAQSAEPALLLIGSPMDASGFAALAAQFPDRTVVTYDPRGTGRSPRSAAGEATPEQHADDLHRVVSALGGGPVDVFGSSGGAVNGLALVARHPERVRTLVAHEPPAAALLPDRTAAFAAIRDIRDTYQRDGFGPAMAKFIALTMLKGPVPADQAERPGPGAADFGLPAEDDGRRDDPLLAQNIVTCTHYEPDFAALAAAATRIVVAVGAESEGELAYRGGVAVAERLGTAAVTVPGNHGAYLPAEYGMGGDPAGFAVALRKILDAS